MLLNLACSDGLIAGFGTPISAAAALQYNWPFSDELCVAYAMIMSTAGIGSITTLTALALWRCQLVVYCPAKRSGAFANHHSGGGGGGGSAKLGRVQAAVLLTLIWAYSLAVTCPPLFGWGRYDREAAHISCSVNWESKMANNRSYILYMFAFGLLVPFLVIVVSYVSILRVVKKTKEMRRKSQASMTGYNMHKEKRSRRAESDSDHQHPSSTSTNKRKPRSKNKIKRSSNSDAAEKRVTVMVACMVGAFMAAWTPYSILALFETFIGVAGHSGGPGRNMSNTTFSLDGQQQFNDNQPTTSNEADDSNFFYYYVGTISPAFATIPSLFAKTSAVFNPLIYGLLNTQFRSAWVKFTSRFLRPRPRRHHRRRRNSKDLAVNISGLAKPNRKKELWQLLNCAGGNSTSLRQSATVHLSMKEIVSNESQSAYVMANTVGGQQQVVSARQGGDQEDQDQRRRPKNPANKTSCSSMSDPETSVTQEQTIQMKSFRQRHPLSVQQQQPEEQPAQEQKAATTTKLAAVGMISESTSCSCTNGDHNVVTTTTLEEEVSVFSADASAGAATTFTKSETHPQTVASVTSACPASIEAK
ncbi:G-protein coupled receptor 161-like [Daphnia pulex]|uniref:G-protein coupled receptor 161-like n=1 Tax=Daphnia pulex TaxID=6669 RepID=UPI001EE07857|nr:G-protein coupled receptor 161-like [Daphnia pulex]